jgi:transposase InsO family protein
MYRCLVLILMAAASTSKESTTTRSTSATPQANGVCERFHKTILDEFYSVAFRKKIYRSLEEIQEDAVKTRPFMLLTVVAGDY